MAQMAVEIGYEIMNGKKPAETDDPAAVELITRDNVGEYKGWSARAEPATAPPGPARAAPLWLDGPGSTPWPMWSASAIC